MQVATATASLRMVLLLGLVLVACGAPWGGMEGPVGHVNAHTSPLHPQALFRGSGEKPGNAGGSRIKAVSDHVQVWLFGILLCAA